MMQINLQMLVAVIFFCFFLFPGPMIDRILCVCQTKQDSLKWVELFKHQTKASRVAGGSNGSHPPPPPHVSPNSQPFEALTGWIRDKLVTGSLGLQDLRALTQNEGAKPGLINSPSGDILSHSGFIFTNERNQ